MQKWLKITEENSYEKYSVSSINLLGFDLYLANLEVQGKSVWGLFEPNTGLSLFLPFFSDKKEAIAWAKKVIKNNKDRWESVVREKIAQGNVPPNPNTTTIELEDFERVLIRHKYDIKGNIIKKSAQELNADIVKYLEETKRNRERFPNLHMLPNETRFVSQYSGKGGSGAKDEGILHQFYTPDWVCDIMYKLALHHGYKGGTILEPSLGTGNIIKPFPNKSQVTAFEPDEISRTVAKIRFPNITIYPDYFETAFLQPLSDGIYGDLMKKQITWLNGYPFSLVITNPPYGQNHNFYSGRMKKLMEGVKFSQIEIAFMLYGLLMLKPGGLLIFITSQNFLRNGNKYNPMKDVIGNYADLIDAYRLPPVFDATKVSPDIIVLKKK